jgi:hypothetical protein
MVLQSPMVSGTAPFTAPFLGVARKAVEACCTVEQTLQCWIRSLFGHVHLLFLKLKLRHRFQGRGQSLSVGSSEKEGLQITWA